MNEHHNQQSDNTEASSRVVFFCRADGHRCVLWTAVKGLAGGRRNTSCVILIRTSVDFDSLLIAGTGINAISRRINSALYDTLRKRKIKKVSKWLRSVC